MPLVYLILLSAFVSTPGSAEPLRLADADKQQHLMYSAAISSGSYLIYRQGFKLSPAQSAGWAFATSLAIGLAKELNDPQFSHADMGANAVGATGGIVLPLLIEEF